MIVKNHNIVLEDTSPAEMARFRQIFKGIWLQQAEDDKNTVEMERYIAAKHGKTPKEKLQKLPLEKKLRKPKVSVPTKAQIAKSKNAAKKAEASKPKVKALYQRGFVITENGIRLHATPTAHDAKYLSKSGRYGTVYKLLSKVTVVHEELDNKGWYKIETQDNQYGYIEKHHIVIVPIDKKLDSYTRTFLHIKPGYNFETNIANYFYANYQYKTGDDRRTLAEAFYLLNTQSKHDHGVVMKKASTSTYKTVELAVKSSVDPTFHKARITYSQLQLTSGHLVRIPNLAYIDSLHKKGALSSRPEFTNMLIELERYHQGFIEGLYNGIYDEIKGVFTGIWDLIKGIFTGRLFKQLWDIVKEIIENGAWEGFLKPMFKAIGKSWDDFWKKFNSGNPRLRAFLIGDIIGRIIFTIALAILTAGATVAIAASTRGAAFLTKFPKIARLVEASIDAIPNSQRRLIEKALKEKAGDVLYQSNKRKAAKELRREIDRFARSRTSRTAKKKIVRKLKKLVILSRFQLIKLFKIKKEILDLLERLGITIRADLDNLNPQFALVTNGYSTMLNGNHLFSGTAQELSKFFDSIKQISDNAGFAETKKILQSIQKTANPRTVREKIENYANKYASKKTEKSLQNILEKGDKIAVNAAEVYIQNNNIRNRVILGKGALEKAFNKPVVAAYIERFKKMDILDFSGKKLDVTQFNESQIQGLFEGKYALYYKGKMREMTFEAHHIVPKELLLDPDLRELHIFVKNNKDKFDFNGIDNGIPIHKYSKEFKELGGHGNHPNYSDLSKKTIQEIKKDSYFEGAFRQSIFDKKLMNHINKTRNEIIKQVATESKKINDLIFKK